MPLALKIAASPPDAGDSAPFNYFLHSHGPASTPTLYLGWVLAAVCAAVCLLVAGLLAYAIWRRRAAAERDVIGDPPRAAALTVAVTGYDWWWRIDYGDGAQRFSTANELHIPVGVPVRVRLDSADVIHAFWVPQLAGKTQMIPGVSNEQWLQADAPGLYRGECTQFCGAQHAHMSFDVIAQSPADFAAWRARQQQGAAPPPPAIAARPAPSGAAMSQPADAGAPRPVSIAGPALFMDRCAGCHTVRGSEARGEHGPDLTHLLDRRMLGAGLLTNTAAHRIDWVTRVQRYKPGARMPDIALSGAERADLGAYLDTLQ